MFAGPHRGVAWSRGAWPSSRGVSLGAEGAWAQGTWAEGCGPRLGIKEARLPGKRAVCLGPGTDLSGTVLSLSGAMEAPAAAAPGGSFFPSFLLLALGTLAATLLGAAHRLGLIYQLRHKVRGPDGRQAGGSQGRNDLPAFLLARPFGRRENRGPTNPEGLVRRFLARALDPLPR